MAKRGIGVNRTYRYPAGSGWAETYGYDAFGSLVAKTPTAGSPPTLSIAVNPANNQVVGYPYDANGNQLAAPALGTSPTLSYDAENRLVAAPGVQYGYDSKNKRVWSATLNGQGQLTGQRAYFYGVDGAMLGVYTLTLGGSLSGAPAYLAVYFRGKRVAVAPNGTTFAAFNQDRLGSQGAYYPYGEDKGTPLGNDQFKFATYWRDSATGLDYADQRYFVSNFGRFMTPDPYRASASMTNPMSWNRFVYVLGDPINGIDPRGLECVDVVSDSGKGDVGKGGCPGAGIAPDGSQTPDVVNVKESIGGKESGGQPRTDPYFSAENGDNMWVGAQDGNHQLYIEGHLRTIPAHEITCPAGYVWEPLSGCVDAMNGNPPPPPDPEPRKPGRNLFGTNYCGVGGSRDPLNELDKACQAHDVCYANNGFSWFSNFNPFLFFNSALQQCNQDLCDSSLGPALWQGGIFVNFYFFAVPVGACQLQAPQSPGHSRSTRLR